MMLISTSDARMLLAAEPSALFQLVSIVPSQLSTRSILSSSSRSSQSSR